MKLQSVRAGKFRPRCAGCNRKFDLSISQSGRIKTAVGIDDGDDDLAAALGMEVTAIRKPPRRRKPTGNPSLRTDKPTARQPRTAEAAADSGATVAPTRRAVEADATVAPAPSSAAADGTMPPSQVADAPPANDPNALRLTGVEKPVAPANDPDALRVTNVPRDPGVPKRLGNYELQKKIGQGGMGSVYLARQISLDRDVALKMLASDLAGDEEFVARFTREAYAAAQLSHHNVVQVYDIGAEKPHHYFSMEFVPGTNLGKTSRDMGQLAPGEAVGLILQAARGLRYAHEMGLVHRDVKPENLLLNDEGIVKVADLGLAKRVGEVEPGRLGGSSESTRTMIRNRREAHTTKLDSASAASATQMSVAMGTPAYMAPEQALDAANVDQRADIYALGCSLYHLLTGRPPFEGSDAEEVMEMHTVRDPVPPDKVADAVPGSLGQIVLQMMAKDPADRPQTMRETIRVLEEWLEEFEGVGVTPTGDAEKTMAAAAGRYVSASMKSVRTWSIAGFYVLCVIGAILFAVFVESTVNKVGLAGACAGLAVTTTLAYLIYGGIKQRTHVWSRLRQLLTDGGLVDALGLLAGGVLMIVVLVSLNLHWWWLGAAVLGVGLAIGFHHAIDVPLIKQREAPLNSVKLLLRRLRKEGYDENALQHFVATKSGDHWEELYEEIFGYDEKIEARPVFGRDGGKERPRHGTWREPLLNWIDRRLEYKRKRRDEKMLIAVEKQRLRSKGIGEAVAEKQARANALRFADLAENFRQEAEEKAKPTIPAPREEEPVEEEQPDEPQATGTGSDAIEKRKIVYDDGKTNRVHESWFRRRFGSPVDIVLGPQLRLLLGFVLMGVFALWLNTGSWSAKFDTGLNLNDNLADVSQVAEDGSTTAGGSRRVRGEDEIDAGVDLRATGMTENIADRNNALTRYLHPTLGAKLSGFHVAIAAMILISSIVFAPRLFSVLTYGSVVATIGLMGVTIPGTQIMITWWIAAAIGGGIYLFALTFFRTDEGY
ncbi:MAG: serine/threonine-protein kinase [Planctomycetota bacterium]